MPDQRYRFRLPDGQVFEAVGLAAIKRQHPDARIEGRVEFNERGEGTLVPYQGEQPADVVLAEEETPAAEGEQPVDVVLVEETPARQRRTRGQ